MVREGMVSGADTRSSQRVGEVVEATSTSFLSQCYKLYEAPPLGGLVRTNSPKIYGVVCRVSTEPLDPSRPVLARGQDAATEEEVYRDHPQLSRLLTSRFEALIAGHDSDGEARQYLPPLPPRVHSFVYACCDDEIAGFTSRLDLLRLLLNSAGPIADEVVCACLRQAAPAHADPEAFLLRAGMTLAAELSGDVPRLNAILRRLRP